MTERQVLDLLRRRHCKAGNGGSGEYAYMEHVRNAAAFNATRTFDAVVLNLWPSRGLELHAFEVKCSRSDWLRELKEPEKAEAAALLVDRFSVVAGGPDIVKLDELPPTTWGLFVVKGTTQLQCVKAAPLLPDADPKRDVTRSFLVAMLRAGGAVPRAEAAEVEAARAAGRAEEAEHQADIRAAGIDELRALKEIVAKFEKAAGVAITGWARNRDPEEIGQLLRAVLDGEQRAERAKKQMEHAAAQLRRAADELDEVLNNKWGVLL